MHLFEVFYVYVRIQSKKGRETKKSQGQINKKQLMASRIYKTNKKFDYRVLGAPITEHVKKVKYPYYVLLELCTFRILTGAVEYTDSISAEG